MVFEFVYHTMLALCNTHSSLAFLAFRTFFVSSTLHIYYTMYGIFSQEVHKRVKHMRNVFCLFYLVKMYESSNLKDIFNGTFKGKSVKNAVILEK